MDAYLLALDGIISKGYLLSYSVVANLIAVLTARPAKSPLQIYEVARIGRIKIIWIRESSRRSPLHQIDI